MAAFISVLAISIGATWAIASPQNATAKTPSSPAAGALPDVVGFRPGITIQEGYNQLNAYDPKGKIDVDNVQIPRIADKPIPSELTLSEFGAETSPEVIQVGITLPPNKQLVWKVTRQLVYPTGREMSRTVLLAALRQKYGPETYMDGGSNANLVWLFDEQGRRVTESAPPAQPCALAPVASNQTGLGMAVLNQPSPTFPQEKNGDWVRCKSLVYVRAQIKVANGRGNEFINWMAVSVADSGLATRAQDATVAFISNANTKQKKQELDRARKQAPPKL